MTPTSHDTEGAATDADGLAVVIGASGAIGGALVEHLRSGSRFAEVHGLSRSSSPALDLTSEPSIEAAAAAIAAHDVPVRLVVVATGFLHGDEIMPEKTWRHLDPAAMAHAFALNAIGPALLMKHFLPLLPRAGRSVFATLSARAGSIGENTIGGWYGYRASKAALNQLVRTAAHELARGRKEAICVALHPGHVESPLSAPFGAGGQETLSPATAASGLVDLIDRLTPRQSGAFLDREGKPIPW
jgi:NAD(P)-dependent dehydrogenase (short-subunit alcohol dehydrogenase family)